MTGNPMNPDPHHRHIQRAGPERVRPQRRRAHRPGHGAHQRPGAHLRRLPGPPVRPLHRRDTVPDGAACARAGRQDTVLIAAGEVKTVLAALDIAADYQRDRAGLCADCTGQTCPACESRLRDAQAYDRLSAQLSQEAQASPAAIASRPEPTHTAEREAGQ